MATLRERERERERGGEEAKRLFGASILPSPFGFRTVVSNL